MGRDENASNGPLPFKVPFCNYAKEYYSGIQVPIKQTGTVTVIRIPSITHNLHVAMLLTILRNYFSPTLPFAGFDLHLLFCCWSQDLNLPPWVLRHLGVAVPRLCNCLCDPHSSPFFSLSTSPLFLVTDCHFVHSVFLPWFEFIYSLPILLVIMLLPSFHL